MGLPRTGTELTNIVSIRLKTSGVADEEESTARFIHQAFVRRRVVIQLIESMKCRGHIAYKHIDMNAVRQKAEALPDSDVPPETIRLLPADDLKDNIQLQKNATPVSSSGSMEKASASLDVTRCNAVVNERRNMDEVDAAARDNAALHNVVRALGREYLHMML